jgi:hypothetical protein
MTLSTTRKSQLFFAAMLWTLVGCGLLGFGLKWLIGSGSEWIFLLVLGAIVVGGVKGHFILRKSALRTIKRIETRPETSNLIGMFSINTWVIIGVMIAGGRFIRTSGLADEFLGALYAAIGAALIMGSLYTWRAYFNLSKVSA